MTSKDLVKKSDKDLEKLLLEKRAELRKFRFDVTGTKIKNIKEGRNLKKEIAQILTELNNRKLVSSQ